MINQKKAFKIVKPTPKYTREEYEEKIKTHPFVYVGHEMAYMRRYDIMEGLVDLPPYRDDIDPQKPSTWPDILHLQHAARLGLSQKFSCAWIDADGIVFACRYGAHSTVAKYYFGMTAAEAEKTHARVSHDMQSTSEMVCGISKSSRAGGDPFLMYRSILRFIYRRPEYADCIRNFALPDQLIKLETKAQEGRE